ncbi:uncharacterized protein LOC116503799 [Thamnophis elegans]|uniref:uncharacterized protein LOC116503799 n=1 Tax=Thamnophis elegans TaxID=35005 RepID=UPI001377B4DC|nr:uncharacterized protein LOC116503799 [Thamnophis elegans]
MMSCLAIVPWARLHTRELQWFLLPSQRANASNSRAQVCPSPKVLHSLRWWWTPALTKGSLFREPEHMIPMSDASLFGWGAHLSNKVVQGRWSANELAHNIYWLELRPVCLALCKFQSDLQGHHVFVRMDNGGESAHQSPRWHQSLRTDDGGGCARMLDRASCKFHKSGTHIGVKQRLVGLVKQSHSGSVGLWPPPKPISPAVSQIRHPASQPIRHPGDRPASLLSHQVQLAPGGRSGCTQVSSSTIGRWLKTCISLVYEHQGRSARPRLTAHSTQSTATTVAWATQASIEEICKAVTWAMPSLFVRHYKLDK